MNQCNPHLTPAKIQCLLKESGYTQKQIAQEEEVSEMAISNVVNFKRVSKRLMEAVARRIDKDPEMVFGSRFKRARTRGRRNKFGQDV